ncbi:isocitrate lyase/phosphoenolpyruvate mutase family protein [Streptomyces sp. SID3343]|uniref:isocitrate lyase/PEP mutase family protein n=1 Tax=Streptomyces sp. SID3343 TaxID=2690260 RepID=UPI00136DC628|nr:isocitrate lyase/phosphoenolpyruvate mutase family protein [Streptomyces sp. SID3343]MYW00760.1 isocitrate lyase/phosphoenolpyruvate mutase family protein [Streptomyces sp. SID3343]
MTNPSRFAEFRALHHAETPLFLPNAWDHASAAALVERGFPAIGTTSLGVAVAAGKPDGEGGTREETLRLGVGLARLPVPVSVDIEGGFAERPEDVARLGTELVRAGVAGVNLEDGRADGTLTATEHQVELIVALKEAAPTLFVNARTDTHWVGGEPSLDEAVRRIRAYRAAGADGVFVPGLQEPTAIGTLVAATDAPLNILYSPTGPTPAALAELGVRRISLGSLLFRAAVRSAVDLAWSVAHGSETSGSPTPLGSLPHVSDIPSYAQAQAMTEVFRER